ncbi:hypothetical protein N7541_010536 [Penicillium brevicompactum]|uniref:DUF6594 domain-containing protein n=1 Tax=Penicillium brevicompactum TaxID=5074 RepID=A0A9W9QNL9_PENBR|nr:hypothetical protein N7541_010536 [Penicillium brevicompactum]
MPLQTKKSTGKDGRKRTYSLVSNISNAQAGPVASPKTALNSSPSQQAKGTNQALKSPEPPKSEPTKQSPNVFEFLDENDESSSASSDSSDSSDSSESESDQEPEPRPKQAPKIQSPTPKAKTVSPGVLASTGNAPLKRATQPPAAAPKGPTESRKAPAPVPQPSSPETQLVTRKRQSATKPSPISTASTSPSSHKGQLELSRPPTYHGPREAAIHRPPLPPSPPRSPEEGLHCTSPRKRRDSAQSASGYGLLASQLTTSSEEKDGLPPLYRRFESINHRVLLHLQDEISQMEEDLQTLDEYEEMHRFSTAEQEGTKPLPASRRRDSQAQVYSSLHYRRMDLMSALVVKTEQYNSALCAYSKVLQTLPAAPEPDITKYRTWMKRQHPIASIESKFLDHRTDLVSLTRTASNAQPSVAAPVYVAIIIASGALLLPLLAFNMIAEFSGRLVVVTVMGGAAAAIAANYSAGVDSLVDSRDGWRCATIYFGFMTLAAMFIP